MFSTPPPRMSIENAEALALSAFSHLAGDEELVMRFAQITGILTSDIRTAASQPGFLVGVLDFYLGNEADLIAFCKATQTDPQNVMISRHTLAPEDFSEC